MSPFYIVKSTGEKQEFNPAKLVNSLCKAGASKDQAEEVLLHIQQDMVSGMTTTQIYHHAFELLRKKAQPVASRYSMRRAIAELGPNGFPFEKFIAEVFKAEGYDAVTDQLVQGHCVEHEVDVVAWKGDSLVMIEAKFHNEQGIKSDLKVALYIKARWDDLKDCEYEYGGKKRKVTLFQLFTNTKFSESAIKYAQCQGLSLVGWNYPQNGNLEQLVEESGLHPLTSLMSLAPNEKRSLLEAGLVLCKQVAAEIRTRGDLTIYNVPKEKTETILHEIEHLCGV